MSEYYFTEDPSCESHPAPCTFDYRGKTLRFTTDAGVFSRGEVDFGTKTLLHALPPLSGRVLDLGCGWGAIGVCVGAVNALESLVLSDVNQRALELAEKNLHANGVTAQVIRSDGLENIPGKFDTILINPPIRAGKQVIYQMFAQCMASLRQGGALYLVIRKQQGAESAVRYLKSLPSAVSVIDRSGGFWVVKAENKGEEA